MRRLVLSLAGQSVYRGQKVYLMKTIQVEVRGIFCHGRQVPSAFFESSTKPIFRSESSKIVLLLHMSREMWDFGANGTGEIMFDRAIDGFLPELFRKWQENGAHHRVTVILFTRVKYEGHLVMPSNDSIASTANGIFQKDMPYPVRDFYRVLVDDASSAHGEMILNKLKDHSQAFLRDVSTHSPFPEKGGPCVQKDVACLEDSTQERILGHPTPASTGNILEAINMSCSHYSKEMSGCQLVRSGFSIIMVTPGTGVFDVNPVLLRATSDIVVEAEASINMVCLSNMPLHFVPLFRYRHLPTFGSEAATISHSLADPNAPSSDGAGHGLLLAQPRASSPLSPRLKDYSRPNHGHKGQESFSDWNHGVPHWMDISFWRVSGISPRIDRIKDRGHYPAAGGPCFAPSVCMNEVQMMGVMENEVSDISIPMLCQSNSYSKEPGNSQFSAEFWTGMLHSDLGAVKEEGRDVQRRSSGTGSSMYADRVTLIETYAENDLESDLRRMDDYDDVPFRFDPSLKSSEATLKGGDHATGPEKQGKGALAWSDQVIEKPPTGRIASHDHSQTPLPHERRGRRAGSNDNRVADILKALNPTSKQAAQKSQRTRFGPHGFAPGAAKAAPVIELSPEVAYPKAKTASNLESASHDNDTQEMDRSIMANIALKSPGPTPVRLNDNDKELPSWSTDRPAHLTEIKPTLSERKILSLTGSQANSSSEVRKQYGASTVDQNVAITAHGPDPSGAAAFQGQTQMVMPEFTHLNPCSANRMGDLPFRLGRWQHAYPTPLCATDFKWKSLCSPASVPLNAAHPVSETYPDDGERLNYAVTAPLGKGGQAPNLRVHNGIGKMVELRLNLGFQLSSELALFPRGTPTEAAQHVGEKPLSSTGNEIVMWLGQVAHRIKVEQEEEDLVVVHVQQQTIGPADYDMIKNPEEYRAGIRTDSSGRYRLRHMVICGPRHSFDWQRMDRLLLEGKELVFNPDKLGLRTARYVLVPDKDRSPTAKPFGMEKDNDEEIRLEAINKLTNIWQKNQVVLQDEDPFEGVAQIQPRFNRLDVIYRTRHPSAVVATEFNSLFLTEKWQSDPEAIVADQFKRSNYDLSTLARAMQGEQGVHLPDRRWHITLYRNCFVGIDLTTWLLKSFTDLKSREDAIELGNELMERGLFVHVRGKHEFRDGNFFYQIARSHALPSVDSKRSWFGRMSSPSTPGVAQTENASLEPSTARPRTAGNQVPEEQGPSEISKPKQTTMLSKAMIYDVDHRRRSDRPELIKVHYDRIASVDDCYHLRVDWVDATPKLVQDSLESWGALVERLGVRLVRMPVSEASALAEHLPLTDTRVIKLAKKPAEENSRLAPIDEFSGSTQRPKWNYHEAILKKFGFTLDLEAAGEFPNNVDVTYSWGRPNYRFSPIRFQGRRGTRSNHRRRGVSFAHQSLLGEPRARGLACLGR